MTRSVQQSSSQAQSLFTYKSTLEIRNESGQVINWEPDFAWDNGGIGKGLQKGNINMPPSPLAQIVYDATKTGVEEALHDYPATVVIKIPELKYEVVSAFCEDIKGTTCSNSTITNDYRTRRNLVIANGAEVKYGVVVRLKSEDPQPTSAPTMAPTSTPVPNACPISGSECAPRNVEISNITSRTIDINWDLPQGCAGFKQGSDYWIDVERPGESIVCVAEGGSDGNKQCVLGKTTGFTPGRQLDTNSEEFRKRAWDENRRYDVKVYTHNASPSCVNTTPGVGSFTYEVAQPTTAPTDTPTGKLQCNRPCIYSEPPKAPSNKPRCWRGACPDNQPNCGGGIAENEINRGCTYAGDVCRINQEVDCRSGEDIGKKSDPKPTGATVTPVPTGKPEEFVTIKYSNFTGNKIYDDKGSFVEFYLGSKDDPWKYLDTYSEIQGGQDGSFQIPKSVLDKSQAYGFAYLNDLSSNFEGSRPSSSGRPLVIIFEVNGDIIGLKQSIKEDFTYSLIKLLDEIKPNSRNSETFFNARLKMIGSHASPIHIKLNGQIPPSTSILISMPIIPKFFGSSYIFETLLGETNYLYKSVDLRFYNKEILLVNILNEKGLMVNISKADGYGDTRPVVTNCTNLQQINDNVYSCLLNSNTHAMTVSFEKTTEKPSHPTVSSNLLIDEELADTQSSAQVPSLLLLCSEHNCEKHDLTDSKLPELLDTFSMQSNGLSRVSCEVLIHNKSIVCPNVLLSTNQINFVKVENSSSGIVARITTQSEVADIDQDGVVSASDLATIIAGYGTQEGDINTDGLTNAVDLSLITGVIGTDVITNSLWTPTQSFN